jgi:PDZ domain-containing protein
MVPEPPPSDQRPQSRRPRWLVALTIFILVAGLGYFFAQRYTSHLLALTPGSATPVTDAISVKPTTIAHTHRGRILFVTVALRTVGPFDYFPDKLNSDIQIVDQKVLVPPNSKPSQLNQLNAVEMQNSTQVAEIVALRRLGYQVDLHGQGAEVNQVGPRTPADGHLVPGDVVTAMDGAPITTNDALVAAIRKHKAGDTVTLTVTPSSGGPTRTETIKLGQVPASPTEPAHAFLGIVTSTKQQLKLPVDVNIDPGNVGGPSAGLAFTLGVMNAMTASDLTGGQTVAVTGTINSDGTVGDVGGVAQKTAAVRKSGAVAFLVPPGEYREALKHAGHRLKVIKVANLGDALTALRSIGGDLSALGKSPVGLAG